jgi:hypothetical protein
VCINSIQSDENVLKILRDTLWKIKEWHLKI